MRVLVVYESMFGSTRQIAEAIGRGLMTEADALVVGVATAPTLLDDFDLVVVGGPTHAWSMSWPSTRRGAPMRADKPASGLVLEPGADAGPGVREWLGSVGRAHAKAAAFDTRINSPVLLVGRASRSIARRLSDRGLSIVVPAKSFLVDKTSHLLPGELERAHTWGAGLPTVADRTRTAGP